MNSYVLEIRGGKLLYGSEDKINEIDIPPNLFDRYNALVSFCKEYKDADKQLVCSFGSIPRPRALHELHKLSKQFEKYPEFNRVFEKIINWIWDRPHWLQFTQSELRYELGFSAVTKGDKIRDILDYCICKGILSKTRFHMGRGGHKWIRKVPNKPCPYWINGMCNCKDFIHIDSRVD